MLNKISAWALGTAFLVTACVTINVYFPAAAAEKAADRIIDDVWQQPSGGTATPPSPTSSLPLRVLVAAADFVLPRAEAQQPNIDISSPEVQRIKDSMQARFDRLKPLLDSGAAGLTGDGLVALRDASAVPLAQRNSAKSLIADENADRAALYAEIATANGQPQWAGQIQSVFAQRWVAKAQAGWWYQDASGWKRK
ncbi:MAG TPA: YdbL family protein [Fontimonas sp.]